MSSACMQKIQQAVESQTECIQKTRSKRRRGYRIFGSIFAGLLCVLFVGTFSAAAIKDVSLLEFLFPSAEQTDVSELSISNCTILDYTITGMKDMTVTPIGAVRDSRTISVVFRVTSEDTQILEEFSTGGSYSASNLNVDADESYICNSYISAPSKIEDGVYQFSFVAEYNEAVYDTEIALDFYLNVGNASLYKKGSLEYCGYFQMTIALGEPLQEITYDVSDEETTIACGMLTTVDIQSMHLQLSGSRTDQASTTLPDDLILTLTDGTIIMASCTGGSVVRETWCYEYNLTAPIDPETAVSVTIGNQTVSFTSLTPKIAEE